MAWTIAQQKVIDTRNKNLLVSAAAGSGKTAVLVERIISMISEGEKPLDIDRLLVVTFTNAAAAEMRERIGGAIESRLAAEPDNRHLQKQASLLPSAQITTIHSFCLYVLRNYFNRIDLDPSFQIADEAEITLMKSDVIGEVLERRYEEGREEFHRLVESYSYSKSDLPIEELVLRLYNFSMSAPWPKEWIGKIRGMFEASSLEEMNQTAWMKELLRYVDTVLEDLKGKNSKALDICGRAGGPAAYEAALLSDRSLLMSFQNASSYEEYADIFASLVFERLSAKKDDSVLPEKKEQVKGLREEVKRGMKDLAGQFFFQPPEDMLADMRAVSGVMQVLFDLTLEFMDEFAAKKEEKNLIDFNDLEHFVLRILVQKQEDGNPRDVTEAPETAAETAADVATTPYQVTEAALELREQYDEILIDEYQDSNMVQETILRSISREEEGRPNRFMVGDVKQSIYKFRLAMPEIFMEKYGSYSCEDTNAAGEANAYQRIDLDKNFRSRRPVLSFVNHIFEQIMQPGVGGILYDEAAALKYGELYEETPRPDSGDNALDDHTSQVSASSGNVLDGNASKDDTLEDGVSGSSALGRGGASKDDTPEGGVSGSSALGRGSASEDGTSEGGSSGHSALLSAEVSARIAQEVELLLVTEEEDAESEDAGAGVADKAGPDKGMIAKIAGKAAKGVGAGNGEFGDTAGAAEMAGGMGMDSDDGDEAVYTKKELEARAVARRIKELTDPLTGMLVFDQKKKQYRPAVFRDIVILLRSMTGWSEVFVNTLMQEGIPAHADTGSGYFQTPEIMTILNMLRIIDNPRQDIPLVGVLYSPMAGLTSTELAMLRAGKRDVGMYSALLHYMGRDIQNGIASDGRNGLTSGNGKASDGQAAANGGTTADSRITSGNSTILDSRTASGNEAASDSLRQKLEYFLEQLDSFRAMVNHKPIHELLQVVLDRTGYYNYAAAMPGGEQRKANIDMLISQAVRFEQGSYSGLFHFIRYMEKLHKYEVDFGEAATSGEQDNTVRIMSIHKSKGLEFPIVIVGGMSKQFNTQDLRSSIVLHSGLGVGPDYVDLRQRTKVPTLLKKVIQKKVQTENLGEELRVLYVAMTRAREKLILSGYLKSREELVQKEFSFFELMSSKSYLDWVLPAMLNRMGLPEGGPETSRRQDLREMSVTILNKKELLLEEVKKQVFLQMDRRELEAIPGDQVFDPGLRAELEARLNYQYPHQRSAGIKVKLTVSELKKLGQFQDEEQSVNLYQGGRMPAQQSINLYQGSRTAAQESESLIQEGWERTPVNSEPTQEITRRTNDVPELTVPAFLRETEQAATGADRGTLYHRILELLDLTRVHSREELHEEFERLIGENKMTREEINQLRQEEIYQFTASGVAGRMRRAQARGLLYKEKQFVIGLKASEVIKNTDSEELVLVQGIIDVFFEEDGELVLLDYKSDAVEREEQLAGRYQVQLEYYKKALEQIMKKPVKEMIIYSLHLAKEIRIDL